MSGCDGADALRVVIAARVRSRKHDAHGNKQLSFLRVLAVAGCGCRARRRVTTRVASLALGAQDCTALEDTWRLHNMAHTPHGQVHDTTLLREDKPNPK